MRLLKSLVCLLFIFSWIHGSAQLPVMNNTSSLRKWDQVTTPSFRIVFPRGHQEHAMRVANTLESIHEEETKTLALSVPKRISIILQDFNAVSNGFIAFGPRRGEFFTMPPQDPSLAGTNDWLNLLSAHEYRHVVQFHHSRQGFTRLMYYLFGQQTQSGTAFSAVPRWFWEGDATLTETLYTRGGRGRIPAFGRIFRANLLEGKDFSYNKQHLRSYKDYVPDHYKLGYYFVTNIRRRTGDPDIWRKVTSDAYKLAFVPFTFSNSLKKHTGEYLVPSYQLMMEDLEEMWRAEQENKTFTEVDDINRRNVTTFTDYSYPVLTGDGNVIVLRSGIGDIAQFVKLSSGEKPEVVFTPGIVNESGMLSLEQDVLVWNEFHYHPRWRQETWSVIKKLDLKTGRITVLTEKSRFSGAALSPDAGKIVTTLSTPDYQNHLVVLDAFSGNVLNRLPNDGGLYAMARWSEDGQGIVALKTTAEGKGVIYLDYSTGEETWLLSPENENIGHPVLRDSMLYYNSPVTGTDNIHALNLSTGKRYQVTESRYGAYNAVISQDGKHLIYNDHRVNGLDVVSIPIDSSLWQRNPVDPGDSKFYFAPVAAQEGTRDLVDSVPDARFPVQRYRRLPQLLNVHSWGLLASTDINTIQAGISSQDVMSSFSAGLGYVYDRSESSGYGYGQISYQGLFPILDATVEYGTRQSDRGTLNGEPLVFDWKETSFIGGIRLPLLLTRSKWLSELSIQERVGITKVSDFTSTQQGTIPDPDGSLEERLVYLEADSVYRFLDDEISNGDIIYNNVNLQYYLLLKQSTRDLYSRYGAVFNVRYYATPFGGDFTGSVFGASGTFYLPSPFQLTGMPAFKHHSLILRTAYQYQPEDFSEDYYRFRNQIPMPRGYSFSDYGEFVYLGVEYALPVVYPDLGLGPVLFLKRLRLKAFYDYGKGNRTQYNYSTEFELSERLINVTAESAGVELMADLNIMRFPQELGIGVRYSRLLTTMENSFDLLLNIEF